MTSPASPRVPARVSESLRYNALLHLVVLIWGFTGVLGRLISFGSVTLVFYRVAIAIPAIAVFMIWSRVPLRIDRSGGARLTGIGVLVAVHWMLFFESIKISNVSIALVCQSAAPFFTALLEPVIFRRRLYPHEVALGVVTTIGVVAIFGFETQYASGIAVGLAAAFVGALFTVINGRLVTRYDSRVISFYELMSALAVMSFVVTFAQEPFGRIPLPKGADIAYLLLLGTVCTAFAFIGGTYVLRRLSPFTVMLTTNLEPVYGILLALAIFGESELMSMGFYAGTAVILLSIWANAIIVRRRIPEIAEEPNGDSTTRHPDAA